MPSRDREGAVFFRGAAFSDSPQPTLLANYANKIGYSDIHCSSKRLRGSEVNRIAFLCAVELNELTIYLGAFVVARRVLINVTYRSDITLNILQARSLKLEAAHKFRAAIRGIPALTCRVFCIRP